MVASILAAGYLLATAPSRTARKLPEDKLLSDYQE